MATRIPAPYTMIDRDVQFSDIDAEYERQHMPELIAHGWPVCWEYINKENIGQVIVALVRRTVSDAPENISITWKRISSFVQDKVGDIMSQLHQYKSLKTQNTQNSWEESRDTMPAS